MSSEHNEDEAMAETAIEKVSRDLKIIESFIEMLDRAEKQNCELIDLMKEMENEQLDILHEFELDKFYRTEGHRKARRLKKIRQTRRVAKDMIGLYLPIKEFSKDNRKMKQVLREVVEKVRRVIEEQSTRVYQPRADMDSCIAGKHYAACRIDISDHIAQIGERREQKKKGA